MKQVLSLQEAEDEGKVGSKASSLARISDTARVPQGFVVSNDSFREFLEQNGIKDKVLSVLARTQIEDKSQLEEASRKIRSLFEEAHISEELRGKIQEAYKDFVISSEAKKAGEKAMELIKAGREKPFVAVRASPKRNGNSSPGIYESKLNVRGDENLIREVKEVWKSFYSPEAIYYRERRGYGHDVGFGVLVQKMLEPDKSVAFLERNPANSQEFLLEGVYGLGKMLSDGEVVPDLYLFERETSQLKEKKVGSKQWIQARNPSTGNLEKQPIQSSKKDTEVLEDPEVTKIISEANKIASRFGFNALIEFCTKNNEIFVLDVSPLRETETREKEQTGESLAQGLGVSPGHFSGEITKTSENLEGKVFLTKMPSEKVLICSSPGAVISYSGSYSCNSAKMARELGIPMIVYSKPRDISLQEGRKVSIDGFRGDILTEKEGIFGTEKAKASFPGFSDSVTATELMVSLPPDRVDSLKAGSVQDAVLNLEVPPTGPGFFQESREELIQKSANLAREVWIRTNPSKDPFPGILETLRSLHRRGQSNAHPLFSASSVEELEDEDLKLPRTARKGLVVKTPVMALSTRQICSQDLDLILIDFDELVNRMFGSKTKERSIINSAPFWEAVENLCNSCKENGIDVCVAGGLNKKTLKRFVESGIDSVLVTPGSIDEARRMLARVEKKLLLESMR